ncbi:MAG: Maf family protein, partial [Candidatus Kariarchaeaceae archaeon]
IRLPFTVIPSEVDECGLNSNPKAYVLQLSLKKAQTIGDQFQSNDESYIIIGCDTIIIDPYQKAIGKPKNRKEAKKLLETLSGNFHTVITGCTILIHPNGIQYQTLISTLVKFRTLSEDEMEFYINKDEWKNKAGGYAIQGLGSLLVEEIRGDYYNVMGLPIHWIWETLINHFGSSGKH